MKRNLDLLAIDTTAHVEFGQDTKLTNYRGQVITLGEYHTWERKYDQYVDETGVYRFPDLGVEMVWVISRNYYSTFDESYEKLKKVS